MQIIKPHNLCCTLCAQAFVNFNNPLRCPNGHSFDVARQGYINLLPVQHKKSKQPGDSKEMVVARQRFLDSDVYEPITNLLIKTVLAQMPKDKSFTLFDAGCGDGYYLDRLTAALQQEKDGEASLIGLDISKPAIIAAAKRNKAITWLVASNKQLPVTPESLDIIVCMFGFPVFEAFKAALKPGGKIILLEVEADHLIELREVIYPEVHKHPLPSLDAAKQLGFELISCDRLREQAGMLNREQLDDLLVMTPHLYRATKEGKEAAARLSELSITIDVCVRVLELGKSS
jgi:23S rRNA (guanine745-N1)-methyltransferase